ncbi:MAG: hypothetical protein LBJ57_03525 [Prevotellaceae bacterium]|jgi:hypothetical protein|nr:hypothetical protein [Prevotellaceae bacterium]
MQTFLLFALVLAFCVLCLEVKVFFSKKRKFPETEIGRSEEMRKRGITCVRQDELDRQRRERQLPASGATPCSGCSLTEICEAKS